MQQLQAMNAPPGHLHFLSLVARFEGSDAELAAALGVSRTTVWRLKAGKISKLGKYILVMEKRVDGAQAGSLDRVLEDLATWSRHSAEVRAVLTSLHTVLHEPATPCRRTD